jgi:hypothetical protein
MTLYDLYLLIYILGAAYALGSATCAILHGETGVLGYIYQGADPPVWALILEVLVAGLFSWVTLGFCNVQNAYRMSGREGFACGVKPPKQRRTT